MVLLFGHQDYTINLGWYSKSDANLKIFKI